MHRATAAWALLIVVTLAFKSFVPMLAAASAGLQGKAVADVCSVYGVRLATVDAAAHRDAVDDMASMASPAGVEHAGDDHAEHAQHASTKPDAPAHPDHADPARDHCALSGLAVCAVFAAVLLGLPAPAAATLPQPASPTAALAADASARWLALRLHAPPPRG